MQNLLRVFWLLSHPSFGWESLVLVWKQITFLLRDSTAFVGSFPFVKTFQRFYMGLWNEVEGKLGLNLYTQIHYTTEAPTRIPTHRSRRSRLSKMRLTL